MYALGNTTAAENAQVQELAMQYPEIKEELQKIEQTLEAYAFANATKPKINVQEKLFSQLNIEPKIELKKSAPVSNISRLKLIAVAAAILFAISALFNIVFYNKNKNLSNIVAENKAEIAKIQNEEEEEKFELNIVHSKFSLPLKLNGTELSPNADAKIYWLTNTGEIFIDSRNLPPTPTKKQYQLWAIVDGKAIDAGLIQAQNGKILKLQKMKTFGKAQAFAITLEAEGGVIASKEKPFVIVKL
jgi:anti-sigma-K factor RskA